MHGAEDTLEATARQSVYLIREYNRNLSEIKRLIERNNLIVLELSDICEKQLEIRENVPF